MEQRLIGGETQKKIELKKQSEARHTKKNVVYTKITQKWYPHTQNRNRSSYPAMNCF